MSKRLPILAGMLGLAAVLIVLLFQMLGITLADLGDALARTPAWLLASIFILTLGNMIAGVARWRAAVGWLSPDAPKTGFLAMLEATTWGAFLGQLVPPQFSMSFARWAAVRHSSAVGVTLYEGLFDFVVLVSGAAAGACILMLGTGPIISIALFGAAILLGCLTIRWIMAAGHWFSIRYSASQLPLAALTGKMAEPLDRASKAPTAILAKLTFWSFVRMALLALRTMLVAVAFLEAIDWATVVISYPVIGIAVSVPFLPAGLGLVEWSWTGLLVLAGATAQAAGITAVLMRIMGFIGLSGVALAVIPLARLRRSPAKASGVLA